jgi:hypothetical protein
VERLSTDLLHFYARIDRDRLSSRDYEARSDGLVEMDLTLSIACSVLAMIES